jgi:PAS domain S-box-containing protein
VELDVTERIRAEKALKQREQELQTLADNTPDILVGFDRDFRHVFINATIERVTGRKREEFLGKSPREVGMPPALCDSWEAAIQSVFDSGQRRSIQYRYDSPDGPRYFASRIVPEFGHNGEVEYALGITRDYTTEKMASDALEDANKRKDQFLATLAHELRNPLAPIRNGLQILRLSLEHSEDAERARGRGKPAARRCGQAHLDNPLP